MSYRNRKLLDLAEDKDCKNCSRQDGTIVAAHSNLQEHGRGKDHPSNDCYHAWLCWRCHSWLDHGAVSPDPSGLYQATREDKALMFRRAMEKTLLHQWTHGLIKVA